MGWTDKDTFEFWVPAQAISKGADADGTRWIQGIASTSKKDLQGEIVDQGGIDFSYFKQHGYFNNDHKPGFDNKVGEPTEVKLTQNGLWVKGFLYKDKKVADDIWEMLRSLEKTPGAKRRIGFSIQGKVKRKDGSTIKECWLQDIAITPCPVNTSTWAEIAKSLSSQKWDLSKDEDEGAEKAIAADSNPLVSESLDSEVKVDKKKEDKEVKKSLSFDESVEYIVETTGMPLDSAQATARVIFSVLKGATTNE